MSQKEIVTKNRMDEFLTRRNSEKIGKKIADMKQFIQIENKVKDSQELSKEELTFIYEIDSKIDGLGWDHDSRIKEILNKRVSKIDAPIIFGCQPSEVAWSKDEINNDTKAYIGPLFTGIFKDYKNFENIFTSFPKDKIRHGSVEAGGKTKKVLKNELEKNKINVSDDAEQIVKKSEFITLKSREVFDLVYLKISDLGFTDSPTTEELYERAIQFGLNLCPPEVSLELRLKYKDQPLYELKYIAMKPIDDSEGHPRIFRLWCSGDGGLWVQSYWARPNFPWLLDNGVVFSLRK